MNQKNTKQSILDKIKASKNVLILISEPDGDEVSAGLALWEIVSQLGVNATPFSHFSLKAYAYLPNIDQYETGDLTKLNVGQYDTIVVLDTAEEYRLIDSKNPNYHSFKLPKDAFVINIDHHPDSNTLFGDINYVLEEVSSTGEVLYDLFKDEVEITPTIATNLLHCFIADTVCFRQTDVTYPQTLRFAAELMEKGADHFLVTHYTYYTVAEKDMRSYIDILSDLQIKTVGNYTYSLLILDEKNLDLETSYGEFKSMLHERIRSISSCNFAIILLKVNANMTQVSIRARDVEIISLVHHLGGGGHPRAAGAAVKKGVPECLEKIDAFLKKSELKEIELK